LSLTLLGELFETNLRMLDDFYQVQNSSVELLYIYFAKLGSNFEESIEVVFSKTSKL